MPVRTLIDLLNNELGYARIFAEGEAFGYELTTYRPRPMPDLFERMGGYPSAQVALAAAQQQLASIEQAQAERARGRVKARQPKSRKRIARVLESAPGQTSI